MIYQVRHLTRIRYGAPVRLARFNLRVKPVDWRGQRLLDYSLTVSPDPARIEWTHGPYVVNVARVALGEPVQQLDIDSRFVVEVLGDGAAGDTPLPTVGRVRRAALEGRDCGVMAPADYLFASPLAPMDADIGAWGARFMPDNGDIVSSALALAQAIKAEFRYDTRATESDTPVIESFRARAGVCQDFAHVMIVALRAAGLPAAYISGFLRTRPPPGKARLVGADATHAWVALWCGKERGWVGFDPTNGVCAGTSHILTAMGRDYGDVSPVDGVFVGSKRQAMTVSVDVAPQDE